jgi:hypothetical protein
MRGFVETPRAHARGREHRGAIRVLQQRRRRTQAAECPAAFIRVDPEAGGRSGDPVSRPAAHVGNAAAGRGRPSESRTGATGPFADWRDAGHLLARSGGDGRSSSRESQWCFRAKWLQNGCKRGRLRVAI